MKSLASPGICACWRWGSEEDGEVCGKTLLFCVRDRCLVFTQSCRYL